MRNQDDVCHIAIPCRNLDEALDFYVHKMGCKLARRYEDRITLDFFGDQLVCHKAPDEVEEAPSMYPRHFGITFRQHEDFKRLYDLCVTREVTFFQDAFTRFESTPEEHRSFALRDPSNNILEFKHYQDPRMMY